MNQMIENQRLVNLTPHEIVINRGGLHITIPPERHPVRVKHDWKYDGTLGGIDVVETSHNNLENVPLPEDGTVFIVSTLAAMILRRKDIVAPDTGPSAIRRGKDVVAITRFQRYT